MSRDERNSTYGRYAERVVPERAGGDSVRRPYEHFPGEAKGKGKGRGKSTGSTWNESTNIGRPIAMEVIVGPLRERGRAQATLRMLRGGVHLEILGPIGTSVELYFLLLAI